MRKLKIGVFGGSKNITKQNELDSFLLGQWIAENNYILITGLAKGVTEFVLKGNKEHNGFSIGFNPYSSELEAEISEDINLDNSEIIINTGMGDRGRNLISVRSCDILIIINGSFGVLNEVTIAIGENKPIIFLLNSGGLTEIIQDIFKVIKSDYKDYYFANDLNEVKNIINSIEN